MSASLRTEQSSPLAFPSNLPDDTDYLAAALADYNQQRRLSRGLPFLRFHELTTETQSFVLQRAQEIKAGKR